MQQVGHAQRHGRLAGARGAGEAHVQVRPWCLEAELLPHPVHQQQRSDLRYLPLHWNQADQLAVEGLEKLVDVRLLAFGGEGDRGVRVQ